MAVDLIRIFEAFTGAINDSKSPERFFSIVNTPLNMTKNSAYVSVTLLSDLLLVRIYSSSIQTLEFRTIRYTERTLYGVAISGLSFFPLAFSLSILVCGHLLFAISIYLPLPFQGCLFGVLGHSIKLHPARVY